jgi:hypothetical protein
VKDQLLRIKYARGENGELYVCLYRGELHIGTVEVNAFNVMKVFRGINNKSPIFVKYLPKEPLNIEA